MSLGFGGGSTNSSSSSSSASSSSTTTSSSNGSSSGSGSRKGSTSSSCKNCAELEQKYNKLGEKLKKASANLEKFKDDNRQLVISTAREKIALQEKLDQSIADNKHLTKQNASFKKTLLKARSKLTRPHTQGSSGGAGGGTLPDINDENMDEEDLDSNDGDSMATESAVFQSPVGKLQHSKSFVV